MRMKRLLGNLCVSVGIFCAAIIFGIFIQKIGVKEHIPTIFVFAIFLISLFTDGYVYGVVSAVIGMFAVNYIFTFPYFAFDFITPGNLMSAMIMVVLSVMTSMLTTKVKLHESMKAESERERMRANLLRAVSHDLRTPLPPYTVPVPLCGTKGKY